MADEQIDKFLENLALEDRQKDYIKEWFEHIDQGHRLIPFFRRRRGWSLAWVDSEGVLVEHRKPERES